LKDLQANILIGQKKKYLYLVYVIFNDEKEHLSNKKWLKEISSLKGFDVTSAYKHRRQEYRIKKKEKEDSKYDRFKYNGDPIVGVYLSKKGLDAISEERGFTKDRAFNNGMKDGDTSKRLNDNHDNWECYLKKDIHVMLMMAHNYENKMDEWFLKVKDSLKNVGELVGPKTGDGDVRPEKGVRWNGYREHFGFLDGKSQPNFWRKKTRFSGVFKTDELDHVLFRSEKLNFASYLVFRKLEQNVFAFNEKVEAIIEAFDNVNVSITKEHAKALIMGRFQGDGIPTVLLKNPFFRSSPRKVRKTELNSFNNFKVDPLEGGKSIFEEKDPDGIICPFHSHIRKANPRSKDVFFNGEYDDKVAGETIKPRLRIVRRGMTYGERDPGQQNLPSKDVGLLFMCFQANIRNQFEKIHTQWLQNENYPTSTKGKQASGRDPLVGRVEPKNIDKDPGNELEYKVKNGKVTTSVKVNFGSEELVRVKGGEYFLATTLSFLKK